MNNTTILPKLGISIDDKFRTFTALALLPLMIAIGGWACNVQTVVTRVNSILTEVAPALQIIVGLLPLLSGKAIPSNVVEGINIWIPRVESDTKQLGDLVQQSQNDLASNPGVQAKINSLIQTTENDILSILPVFQVLDKTLQQKITGMVMAVGAAIISVENIINAAEGKVSVKKAASSAFVHSGDDFKKKFNSVLHSPTGDPAVDSATAKLNL